MCLTVVSGPHVVKGEPKLVYKILSRQSRNQWRSPYQLMKYTPDKCYEVHWSKGMVSTTKSGHKVLVGLHAFDTLLAARTRIRNINYYVTMKIHIMAIPVGGVYFLGTNGEIVSNKLATGYVSDEYAL